MPHPRASRLHSHIGLNTEIAEALGIENRSPRGDDLAVRQCRDLRQGQVGGRKERGADGEIGAGQNGSAHVTNAPKRETPRRMPLATSPKFARNENSMTSEWS